MCQRKLWCIGKSYDADTIAETLERWPGRAAGSARPAELLEPSRVNAVLLHLEVQGFVGGLQMARRLALVAPGGLEDPADRLPLGVRHGRLPDRLQRGAARSRSSPACGRRGSVAVKERELRRLNHLGSQEGGPANDVPKLPDVPRPGVVEQDLRRLL